MSTGHGAPAAPANLVDRIQTFGSPSGLFHPADKRSSVLGWSRMVITILIIDDDVHRTKTLRTFLQAAGYEVWNAGNYELAGEMPKERPADLVIVDLNTPQCNGLKTISRLNLRYPDLRIVATSSASGRADWLVDIARVFGAERVFARPYRLEQLLEQIRKTPAKDRGPHRETEE